MKFDYEELNELYRLFTEYYEMDVSDELVYKVGGAINLVDECGATDQSKVVMIEQDPIQVLVTIRYDQCWPDFLVDQVQDGSVSINSAYAEFVTVEMKYPNERQIAGRN